MRIVCPGYRDPLEQLFRDESAAVTRRAQNSYKASSSPNHDRVHAQKPVYLVAGCTESQSMHDCSLAICRSFCAPQPSLTPSIEDVALARFMSSYVPGSHFAYLPDLYRLIEKDAALPATVHAVSLARLAWERGQPILMSRAKGAYAKALTKTNTVLSDPATATSNAALVSVLLLSLYEIMIWSDAGTPDNWTTHTRGALALVKLRGKEQLNTLVGRQLFTQVINIICVDSLRSHKRLPPDVLELQNAALEYEVECPRFRLSSWTGELAGLLADINEGRMTSQQVVKATLEMDAKYTTFLSNLPSSWQYSDEALEEEYPDVYGRAIHRYSSNRAAQFWNSYRMTRIFLNGVMHGHARCLRPSPSSLLAKAERNVQQMATDICASVPHFTHPDNFSVASAATLLWPLSTVRGADLVRQDLRTFAEERLKFLGRSLYISQAEKVASCRGVDPLQDGLHMFYLS